MQRYCSAKRIAYNSLLDGSSLEETIHALETRRELSQNWSTASTRRWMRQEE
jgi:hypothetical protein